MTCVNLEEALCEEIKLKAGSTGLTACFLEHIGLIPCGAMIISHCRSP